MSYQTVSVSGFTSKNKIPEYAREYKREYQLIRGINKEFSQIRYFMQKEGNVQEEFISNKLDRAMSYIKKFLRAQENGKFKDISHIELDYFDIENIYEIKKDIHYYYSIIQEYYDWSRGENDKGFLSRYDIYKHDSELFLSKLNIEIEDSDDDSCDSDDNYNIIFSDSDSDSDSENLDFSYTDSDIEDFGNILNNLVKNSSSDSDSDSD